MKLPPDRAITLHLPQLFKSALRNQRCGFPPPQISRYSSIFRYAFPSQIQCIVASQPDRRTPLHSATCEERTVKWRHILCCLFFFWVFYPEIQCIINLTQPKRQTLLFSATSQEHIVICQYSFFFLSFFKILSSTSDRVCHGSRATWETDALVLRDF